MGLKQSQLKSLISRTIDELDMYSDSAVVLIMGTCAVESQFGYYIKQLGNGPAKGIFQMEPATETDIWKNYIRYKGTLGDKIFDITGCGEPNVLHLEGNLLYQIAMTRTHYRRVRESLPSFHDLEGMAKYWKRYYNTHLGAGTTEHFIKAYNKYCI